VRKKDGVTAHQGFFRGVGMIVPNDARMNELLPFDGKSPQRTDQQREVSWNRIAERLYRQPVVGLNTRRNWLRFGAAAAILVLLGLSIWPSGLFGTGGFDEYHAEFGQTRRVVLADQSVVTLNGNSTLRVPKVWTADSSRNVWLDGEAYFEVARQRVQFVVHTKTLVVKVLGTKFNVNAYSNEAAVALKEGSVEVEYQQEATGKKILMKPGQQLKTNSSKKSGAALLVAVPKDLVADWAQNYYHFHDTPLPEIGAMIFNRFGYSMVLSDEKLEKRCMQGTLTAATLEELVHAIEITMSLKIEKNDANKSLYVKS
jgi:transmembrane sensor